MTDPGGALIVEEVPAALAGERVDRFLSVLLGCSRSVASSLIDEGAVTVNGGPVDRGSERVAEGDRVEVDDIRPDPRAAMTPDASVELDVVYDDEDVIVVDKPAGLVVHPGAGHAQRTLVHGLLARYPEVALVGEPDRPGIVHRLDRGTSGLLMVARSETARASLVGQLGAHTVERRYWALAAGLVEADEGVIDAPIGRSSRRRTRMAVTADGRPARTRYEVVTRYTTAPAATELSCRLETGRTHQVRVHLAAIGHAILGDERYGGVGPDLGLDRPALHAAELGFQHPRTGEGMRFESPLPPDLEAVRARLRGS